MSEKSAEALKTIGEVDKELNLIETETGKAKTYILRFWEKEFPQLKPKLRAKGRRYYTAENVKLLKKIQYLLKDKGLTIKGAKKIIENKDNDYIQFRHLIRQNIRNARYLHQQLLSEQLRRNEKDKN